MSDYKSMTVTGAVKLSSSAHNALHPVKIEPKVTIPHDAVFYHPSDLVEYMFGKLKGYLPSRPSPGGTPRHYTLQIRESAREH